MRVPAEMLSHTAEFAKVTSAPSDVESSNFHCRKLPACSVRISTHSAVPLPWLNSLMMAARVKVVAVPRSTRSLV
jgi:hypothetical protein